MRKIIVALLSVFIVTGCQEEKKQDHSGKAKKPLKDGVSRAYFKDGKKKTEIPIKDGKKHGLAIEYYNNGNKFQEVTYKEGIKEGVARKYFETGQLAQETNYLAGLMHGTQKKYRANGKMSSEAEFYKDEPCIGLKEYLLDGTLKKKYPQIVITPKDRILEDGTYILNISLTDKVKEVEYYVGELTDGKYIGSKASKIWTTDRYGKADITFQLLPGQFIMEKVNIIAKIKTTLGNYYIAQKSTNVAIESR